MKIFNIVLGALNALQTAGGDVILNNHILKITDAPEMDYRKIQDTDGILLSLTETSQIVIVTPVVAALQEFAIIVRQFVPSLGRIVDKTLTYVTAVSGDTATTICTARKNQLDLFLDLQITGVVTAGTFVLTAKAGAPLFSVQNITLQAIGINSTTSMLIVPTIVSNTFPASPAPAVFTTSAPHGLVVGNVITITTDGDPVAGTYRVDTVPLTTTFTLASVNGFTLLTASSSTIGTIAKVAQRSRGALADLVANGVTGGIAGQTYSQIRFEWERTPKGNVGVLDAEANRTTVYANEGAANHDAYITKVLDVVDAVVTKEAVSLA